MRSCDRSTRPRATCLWTACAQPAMRLRFSGRGNPVTEEQQWRKLELVAAVAEKVWNAA